MRRAIVIAVLASPLPAFANGFAVSEQTSTAAGTGGAGVAREDEAGAAWTNPAALAACDGEAGASVEQSVGAARPCGADGSVGVFRLGLGVVLAHPSLAAEAMDGSWTTDADGKWSTPPHVQAAYSHGRWAAGVAAGVPFGSGVSWPDDWPGRFEIVRSRLEVFRVAPFVAIATGKLRVAAGFHVDAARMRVARQLDFIDVEGAVVIDMDGRGVGGHAAVYYQASPSVAVGATYKSRTAIDLDGGADFTTPDAFAGRTPDQPASTSITLPDRIVVGGRWSRGRWSALADAELTLWGTYDELTIDFSHDATPDVTQHPGWHTTLGLRGGLEARATRTVTARAGAAWDPTPAPAETLAPSSPDSSRIAVTAGATVDLSSSIKLDAFAEQLFLLGRETRSMDALPARYGGNAQLFGVTIRFER